MFNAVLLALVILLWASLLSRLVALRVVGCPAGERLELDALLVVAALVLLGAVLVIVS